MKTSRIEKFIKATLIIALIAALAATLSACSIFDSLFKTANNGDGEVSEVTSISISVENGLTADGIFYTAVLGQEFVLKAVPNENAPASISYKWYVGVGEGEAQEIEGQTGETLTYTLTTHNSQGYRFTVKAGDVSGSNTVTVMTEYASIDNVSISSTTDSIEGGVIQQKLVSLRQISLTANWNKDSLNPTEVCTVKWFVGSSVTESSTLETFLYTPEAAVKETIIKVRVYDSDGDYKEATVTVSIIERYAAVSSVTLDVNSGATAFGSGALTQYKQIGLTPAAISVSAVCEPSGSVNNSAAVKWVWTHYDSAQRTTVSSTLSSTGRTAVFTPAYGENYLTAEVDNVISRHAVFVVLGETDYNSAKSEIEDAFVWGEGVYNCYLTSQTDFNAFVNHMALQKKTASSNTDYDNMYKYKAASYFEINAGSEENPGSLDKALDSLSEAGTFLLSCYGDYFFFDESRTVKNTAGEYVTAYTVFGNPTVNYTPATNVTQVENVLLHYSEIPAADRRTALPVDSFTAYPETVTNSDVLYRSVSWGYKPSFASDANGQRLQALYNSARDVLLKNVKADASDFEKVRIIYEWIAQKTDYDYALVANTSQSSSTKLSYNAYYLEGVFTDADGEGHGQGVCDARSKAFALLCGMEGIQCVRVTGKGKVNGQSENHAWNKVLLDADDNGIKEWYFCDPTWGDRGGSGEERLTMQYFLVTDSYVSGTHIAESNQYNPAAVTSINVYAQTEVENGDDSFDLYIDSMAEFEKAVDYAIANDLYLDVKVASSVVANKSAFITKLKLLAVGERSIEYLCFDEANGLYLFYVQM